MLGHHDNYKTLMYATVIVKNKNPQIGTWFVPAYMLWRPQQDFGINHIHTADHIRGWQNVEWEKSWTE